MHDNAASNAWGVLQRLKELDQGLKEQKLNHRNPSSSKRNDFLEWVMRSETRVGRVRIGDAHWQGGKSINHMLQQLTIFKPIQFSFLAFLAQLPRSSSFSFLLILLGGWNLEQWGLRWPKAPQWWQTMCLDPLGFLGRDLTKWCCSLFIIEHCVYGFSPKLLRDILVEEHHSRHLLNDTIFSFNNPILLRCLWSRKFLLDSIFITKGFKFCILKFFPMITSYFGNGNPFSFWSVLQSFSIFSNASDFSLRNST